MSLPNLDIPIIRLLHAEICVPLRHRSLIGIKKRVQGEVLIDGGTLPGGCNYSCPTSATKGRAGELSLCKLRGRISDDSPHPEIGELFPLDWHRRRLQWLSHGAGGRLDARCKVRGLRLDPSHVITLREREIQPVETGAIFLP